MSEKKPELVMIDTLDGFVKGIQTWHSNKTNVIKHMREVPEGTEITRDDGEVIVLTGEPHKAFILGLDVALSEIGELPFEAEIDFLDDKQIITDSAGNTH